jgi:hypothetical protein
MVAVVLGLGFDTQTGGGAGFAFGVEGGYTFPMHLYIGGAFDYKVGGFNTWLFEPQVGYDLALFGDLPIMLRPYIGLGYESLSYGGAIASGCNGNAECEAEANAISSAVSTSAGGFVISPGVLGTYAITPHIYVGGELRFDIGLVTGGTAATVNILGTGGYRF